MFKIFFYLLEKIKLGLLCLIFNISQLGLSEGINNVKGNNYKIIEILDRNID
jgi:hypothetical protein